MMRRRLDGYESDDELYRLSDADDCRYVRTSLLTRKRKTKTASGGGERRRSGDEKKKRKRKPA